jgi:hypothetical protein
MAFGRSSTAALLGAVLVLAGGCGAEAHGPDVLALEFFRQAGTEGVLLNETLVFHFSTELEPTSVTSGTVRILDEAGRPARGQLLVERGRLEFRPALPSSPKLVDGGLLPGRRYAVELAGFPRPDGLRGRGGELLPRCLRFEFRTVSPAPGKALFVDPINEPLLLRLATDQPGPLDPLRLVCSGPLDPTSLRGADFELRRHFEASAGGAGGADESGDPDEGRIVRVPLTVTLSENTRAGAVLELRPEAPEGPGFVRPFDPGDYFLRFDPAVAQLRDLGGRAVRAAWDGNLHHLAEIRVVRPGIGRLREEFDTDARRSPAPVEGVDGTAAWRDGVVTVRLPAAVGDGSDGAMVLRDELDVRGVQAESLLVPPEARCELTGPGNVVLRAQRGVRIEGGLVRRVEPGLRGRREGEDYRVWRSRDQDAEPWVVPRLAFDVPGELPAGTERPTLSAWLATYGEGLEGWTVVIAGGDLVVAGVLDVDGPLLLVTGGRLRVTGRLEAREVHVLGEGGGNIRPVPSRNEPLLLDEPIVNPLVAPLRVALQSSPIRPASGVARWRPARFGGRRAGGALSVRFVGERTRADGRVELFGPVDDLVQLAACPVVRLWLELEVAPGGAWSPPVIDWVELAWDEPVGSRQ